MGQPLPRVDGTTPLSSSPPRSIRAEDDPAGDYVSVSRGGCQQQVPRLSPRDHCSGGGKKSTTADERSWPATAACRDRNLGVAAPATLDRGGNRFLVGDRGVLRGGKSLADDDVDGGGGTSNEGRTLRCWQSDATGELQEVAPWESRERVGSRDYGGIDKDAPVSAVSGNGVRTHEGRRRRRTEATEPPISRCTEISNRRASSPDLGARAINESGMGAHSYIPSWAGQSQQRRARQHCHQQRDGVEQLSPQSNKQAEQAAAIVRGSGHRGGGGGDGGGGTSPQNHAIAVRRRQRQRDQSASPEPPPEELESLEETIWAGRDKAEGGENRWNGPEDVGAGGATAGGGDTRRTREARGTSPIPDPSLLSTLKRGGSRNAR